MRFAFTLAVLSLLPACAISHLVAGDTPDGAAIDAGRARDAGPPRDGGLSRAMILR